LCLKPLQIRVRELIETVLRVIKNFSQLLGFFLRMMGTVKKFWRMYFGPLNSQSDGPREAQSRLQRNGSPSELSTFAKCAALTCSWNHTELAWLGPPSRNLYYQTNRKLLKKEQIRKHECLSSYLTHDSTSVTLEYHQSINHCL
jgi:hypothetical protein